MGKSHVAAGSHQRKDGSRPAQAAPNTSKTASWCLCLVLITACLVGVSILVERELGATPYMDEIFHLRQTYHYCAYGNWTHWDSKITTLPGLYGLATAFSRGAALIAQPVLSIVESVSNEDYSAQSLLLSSLAAAKSVLSGESEVLKLLCSYPILRLVINPLCAIISAYVIHRILVLYNPTTGQLSHALRVLVIFTFPLSFFFNFLYYTDTGSLLFILITLWAVEAGNIRLSALPATIAILFRQTNVVWIAFVAVHHLIFRAYESPREVGGASGARATEQTIHEEESTLVDDGLLVATKSIPQVLLYSLRHLLTLISQFFFHAALLGGFAAFVWWNGGITVGDREAHKPVSNFPQVLYFLAFTGIFAGPLLILSDGLKMRPLTSFVSSLRRIVTSPIKHGSIVMLALAAISYAVDQHTSAHPYLLADNRHYTFYIWQRFFMRYEWFKYYMIPIYFASFGILARQLQLALRNGLRRANRGAICLWIVAFFTFTSATLVPSPLLEFRYFITPFVLILLVLLGRGNPSMISLVTQIAFNGAINAITIYTFLYKSFPWENAAEQVARFMW